MTNKKLNEEGPKEEEITDTQVSMAKKEADEANARWLNLLGQQRIQREKNPTANAPKKQSFDEMMAEWLASAEENEQPEPIRTQRLNLPPELRQRFKTLAQLNPILPKEEDPYESHKTRGNFMVCPRCGKHRFYWTIEDVHKWADENTLYCDGDKIPACEYCRGMRDGHGTRKTQATEEWEEKTPRLYREGKTATSTALFPDKEAWEKLLDWDPKDGLHDRYSLYICGKNRCGKSRMLFELLRRKVCNTAFTLKILLAGDFRKTSVESNAGRTYSEEWVDEMMKIDVLVFDDFDKSALTDTSLRSLFAIIDYRLSNGKVTIFLSNYSIDELDGLVEGRGIFAKENMAGIVNRICEFAVILPVKKQ